MKVLILGVNGFIGSHLAMKILQRKNWSVTGFDRKDHHLQGILPHSSFTYHQGDLFESRSWVDGAIAESDVVLPLVAVATPEAYVEDPLHIFELDFEENLRIVRECVKHGKRVIFPSSSEVYGMCPDDSFHEDRSNLVLGPVSKSRWIYSSSKQLLDRVLWAYGEHARLPFTIIRPFNWLGPRLDSVAPDRDWRSRSLTEFIANLLEGTPIRLVNGGMQTRSFCDVEDGVDCLVRILEDGGEKTNGEIINIGFPDNEFSIAELADLTRQAFEEAGGKGPEGKISDITRESGTEAYGEGYQDVDRRKPCIDKAAELLDWKPTIRLPETVRRTVKFYLENTG